MLPHNLRWYAERGHAFQHDALEDHETHEANLFFVSVVSFVPIVLIAVGSSQRDTGTTPRFLARRHGDHETHEANLLLRVPRELRAHRVDRRRAVPA
jgi:hypothetical protein